MTKNPTADDLYRVVKGQLGYEEKGGRDGKSGNVTQYGAKFGMNGVPWCSIFVWWCFMQVGLNLKALITGSYASADAAMRGWAAKGWKIVRSPKLMDVVFFHFEGEHAGANHTGFAVASDAGGVHTIEGNTSKPGAKGSQVNGGGVYARYRPYSQILGYGRYPFAAGAAAHPSLPKAKPVQGRTYPTLKQGSQGNDVKRLQYLLHLKLQDGDFGAKTKAAVVAFQKSHHLLPDGVAGPATLRALGF